MLWPHVPSARPSAHCGLPPPLPDMQSGEWKVLDVRPVEEVEKVRRQPRPHSLRSRLRRRRSGILTCAV
jgi:hypothetical protein